MFCGITWSVVRRMRQSRFRRSLSEEVLIRRPDPGCPHGFDILSTFSCVIEQKRFLVNSDLALNVQEKLFEVSVRPPNGVLREDDHLVRLKYLGGVSASASLEAVLLGHWELERVASRSDDVSPYYYFPYVDTDGLDRRSVLESVSSGDHLVFEASAGISQTVSVLSFAAGAFGRYMRFVEDPVLGFDIGVRLRVSKTYLLQSASYLNASENVLRVRNIAAHPQSQLVEAVEIGVLN